MSLPPTLQALLLLNLPEFLSLAVERILTSMVTSGGLFKLLQLYIPFLRGERMHLMGLLGIKLGYPQEVTHM